MGSLLTTKLREDALELRRLAAKSINARSSLGSVKEKMMREIHLILTLMLGPPPNPNKEFTWEYYDTNDKFQSLRITPLKFAKELSSTDSIRANCGTDINEVFSLVNDPRNKYNELLSVSRLGNVVGLRGIRYVNVDMEVRIPTASFLSGIYSPYTDHENRLHRHAPVRPPHLLRQRRWQIQQLFLRHHGHRAHRL